MSGVLTKDPLPLWIVLTLAGYSILLALLMITALLIKYIIRLRRNSVCRKCKIAFNNESVPLNSNVELDKNFQPKLNLKYQNDNKNLSSLKARNKLALPDAEIPLEIHHYEEIMDRIKTQEPELYNRVIEPLQRSVRERIRIDNEFSQNNSTDQRLDMPGPTYEEVIDNSSDNVYDIFVNFPKTIPNHNMKDLQPSSSETSQKNKTNKTSYLEAKQITPTKDYPQKIVYDSEVVPLKSNAEPEITVQRKFNLKFENVNEKPSQRKTHNKLTVMPDYPKKCRKKRNEMEVPRYEKIIDSEKSRQSEMYKAVLEQLFETTLRDSTKTDKLKETDSEQVQYFDMLSHTYEEVIYNNSEKADYKTPKRSISFRSSFGMKDHLKYLQPSSSHTSEDDMNDTTYLEAKEFIPTEDCPQNLRSLCSSQNRNPIELKRKRLPGLPLSRIRTQSDSKVSFKGFF